MQPTEGRVRLRTGETVRVQETGEGPPALLILGAVNAGTSCPLRDVDAIESYTDDLVRDVLDALDLPAGRPPPASTRGR